MIAFKNASFSIAALYILYHGTGILYMDKFNNSSGDHRERVCLNIQLIFHY